MGNSNRGSTVEPVECIPPDLTGERKLEEGVALCLSGGGYRAMVFHLGALWRLHEVGLLKQIKRISSVSGGSITAGVLALAWEAIGPGGSGASLDGFVHSVVKPVRYLAGHTIDRGSIASGLLLPGRASDFVADSYDKHLFHGATLQHLPDIPRFIFNATNLETGALFRFSKPYLADWRLGRVLNPDVSLAQAVAASSAFPPYLSPFVLECDPEAFTCEGADLTGSDYRDEIFLTDGGVYDNLGLETTWKRYATILVSDGGGQMEPDATTPSEWVRHQRRVLDIIDNQVRTLRKRQLIGSFQAKRRQGAYWGIRTDIADYRLEETNHAEPLSCPHTCTMELARIPTRLKRLSDDLQERLINWGYAVCDAALRRHVDLDGRIGRPEDFPYRNAKV